MAIELPASSTDRVTALEKEVEQIQADLEVLLDRKEGTNEPDH